MHNQINETAVGINALIAALGGVANALSSGKKGINIVASMLVASFTGSMAGLLVMSVFGDTHQYLTLSVAGSFGFAGEKGMYWIISTIKNSIKANIK